MKMNASIKGLSGFALALGLLASPAAAQVSGDEEAELRVAQQQQFEAMFNAPDDVDLMFQYALTSIRLQDFEAAITTLERILIYNPNLPRVKVELGAAYFRIGSYPVAKFYFNEVLADNNVGPTLKERSQTFVDEIDRRTRTSYFTGRVGPDFVFTTNANFGPEDRNAVLFGVPAVLLGANVTDQSDFGVGLTGQVSHVYDLGLTSDDVWRTDLAFSAVRYADVSDGATDVALLRSGPRLSLDDDRYGPKIRPYVEMSHIRFSNDPLQSTIGGGFELTNTVDQSMSLFSDLRVAWVDNHTPTNTVNQDGLSVRGTAGVNYFVDKNLSLRGFGIAEFSGAETDSEQSFEFGLGARATYRYDSGLDIASRDWALTGGVRAIYRIFEEPDFQTDPTKEREDFDLRLQLIHTAYLEDDLSVVARAEYFIRDSNVPNFDLDRFTMKIGFRYSF